MTVHIGIVTFNSQSDLPICFEGIRAQSYSPLTITVVDNASEDDSAEWIAQNAPDASLIRNAKNVGFGNAHNQIIYTLNLSEEDFYLALNPDVILEPTYIQSIVEEIQSDDRIGWATGKLLSCLGEPAIYSVGHALFRNGYAVNIGHGMVDTGQFNQSCEVFGASGAAVMMKAAFIRDLAPQGDLYDRDMFMYGEDVDVDWRGQRRGWKCLYVADAIAYHQSNDPHGHLRTHALVNRYLGVMKNADRRDLIFYHAPMIVLHTLFRLIFTPRQGLWMTWQLLRLTPCKIRQRHVPSIPNTKMRDWFVWAKQQPTNQPTTLRQRLADFFRRYDK